MGIWRSGGIDKTTKITALHRSRRYCADRSLSLILPKPVRAEMEKRAIFSVVELGNNYGPTDGEAIVVLLVDWGRRVSVGRETDGKKSVGIEKLITQYLEDVSVKLAGAGRHVESDGALPNPIPRIKGRTVDPKLVDRFIGWIDIGLVAGVVHKSDRNAVELNFIQVSDAAIDVMGAGIPLIRREQDT